MTKSRQDLADESLLSGIDPVLEVGTSFKNPSVQDSGFSDILTDQFDLKSELQKIPQKIYFRIGEVADLLRLKTYVLRFWETEFPMVAPKKSKTGQRVYQRRDVELLFLIKHLLYVERFSIEGARKRIRDLKREGELKPVLRTGVKKGESSQASASPSSPQAPQDLASVRAELEALRAEIAKRKATQTELRQAFSELEAVLRTSTSELFHY